ncbi:MAG TPA: DUF1559 domain-containing protein [Pirellulales bacterium]
MEAEPQRSTFTLKNLLAVMLVIAVLLGLAAPAIQAGREAARRNQCSSRTKIIAMGLLNHHDIFKRFPPLSGQGDPDGSADVWQTAPGSTFAANTPAPNGYAQSPASAAGYGWLVMILPYLEEHELFDALVAASDSFSYEAFSTTGARGLPFSVPGSANAHFATVQFEEFQCPSVHGDGISTASTGTARPPVTIAAYARLSNGSARLPSGVATTNYVALSATHLACMGLGPGDPAYKDVEPPNGVIVPGKGLSMKSVVDGTSKTLILCETNEPAVSSWYDGTVCWTVGANPSASKQPAVNGNGWWSFPEGTTDACGLNFGPGAGGQPLFAPGGTTPAQLQPVSWGPSSYHIGGVVMHLACDGSSHAITSDIDPTLYLQLITRAGREPVVVCDTAP